MAANVFALYLAFLIPPFQYSVTPPFRFLPSAVSHLLSSISYPDRATSSKTAKSFGKQAILASKNYFQLF